MSISRQNGDAMKTLSRFIFGLLVLAVPFAPKAKAQDYTIREEGWNRGSLEGWYDADPSGKMTLQLYLNPGGDGAPSGTFNAQSVPFPETDAFVADATSSGGRFTGDYFAEGYLPNSFSFHFLAADTLPSYLWLRFSGYDGVATNTFRTLLTNQVTTAGSWQSVAIPLNYDTNLWFGGTGQAFSNTLSGVEWVDLRVTRSGTQKQSYYLDNFALTLLVPSGVATNDTDGDDLPDFWEQAYFNNPTNAVPGDDDDGDGYNNQEERFAGSDPTDRYSHLQIWDIQHEPQWAVVFPSAQGRVYHVETREHPHTGPWTTLTHSVAGDGGLASLVVTNTATSAWYRLDVQLP